MEIDVHADGSLIEWLAVAIVFGLASGIGRSLGTIAFLRWKVRRDRKREQRFKASRPVLREVKRNGGSK